jgi:hypothetical protein
VRTALEGQLAPNQLGAIHLYVEQKTLEVVVREILQR